MTIYYSILSIFNNMKVSPFLEEIFELVAIFLDKSGQ